MAPLWPLTLRLCDASMQEDSQLNSQEQWQCLLLFATHRPLIAPRGGEYTREPWFSHRHIGLKRGLQALYPEGVRFNSPGLASEASATLGHVPAIVEP